LKDQSPKTIVGIFTHIESEGGVKQQEIFLPISIKKYKIQLYQQYSIVYHLCIQYIIIKNIIHQGIIKNHRYIIKQNLHGNPNGRKQHNDFLYIKYYIHRNRQLPNSPSPTRRRFQPPIYRLQLEGIYNSLNSPATTGRRLQPPNL
jgi:hypothetical protein